MPANTISNILDTMTTTADDEALTAKCQFCGRAYLTSRGLWVQTMRPENAPELHGIPEECPCPDAQNARERARKEQEEQRATNAAKRRTKARQRLFDASGMPPAWERRTLRDWKITSFEEQKAYNIAAATLAAIVDNQDAPSLYIYGSVGTGKTFLASCLARDLHRAEKPALWSSVGSMLSDIKTAYNTRDVNEREILAKYQTAPLLILDDLGKEKTTIWSCEQLFRIINARYDAELTTIITSNYNSRSLVERLTPQDGDVADKENAIAIIDRLLGMCTPIKLTGSSKRRTVF